MEGPWTAGLVVLTCYVAVSLAGELTFELADNDRQCFYEDVDAGVKCTLEYQVLAGGNYDVDVVVFEEDKPILKRVRSTSGEHKWTSEHGTDVVMCFLNKFSIVTSKKIWLRFDTEDPRVSPPPPGPPVPWLHDAATFMESSCVTSHENLKLVIDYQTHFRLREAQGRAFAESLNERVNYWSIAQTVILILVGIGQVVVLRSFFTENKKHQGI
ncbi:TMED7 [Branchiostoma lanceolatum]|uniref:TMED7 protein n=1 Tax=Branchiostoma lanceolatum TaxID=7740 RepID=A0A8J9ZF00_BRALA|nr:TMED7 [Branchiostoma lanceolatum]